MRDKELCKLSTIDAAQRIREEKAALMVAQGKTGVEVAKEMGVTPSHISRLKHDPEFAALVQQHHNEWLENARNSIKSGVLAAVSTLTRLCADDEQTPKAVQARAACELLDRAGISSKADKPSDYSDLEALAPSDLRGQLEEAFKILSKAG